MARSAFVCYESVFFSGTIFSTKESGLLSKRLRVCLGQYSNFWGVCRDRGKMTHGNHIKDNGKVKKTTVCV